MLIFTTIYNLGEVGEASKTVEERSVALVEDVHVGGTHVMFENKEVVAWTIKTDPQLKYKAGKDLRLQTNSLAFRNLQSSISAKP